MSGQALTYGTGEEAFMVIANESPLVFQGRLTEEDVVLMRHYLSLMVFRRPFRWFAVGTLTLAGVGLVAWSIYWGYVVGVMLFSVLWAHFLILALVALFPRQLRWMTRQQYRKNEAEYQKSQVTLAEDRVVVENPDHYTSMSWRLVGRVASTPEGILFCDRALRALFWLPERVLTAPGSRERVLEMAAERGVTVQQFS